MEIRKLLEKFGLSAYPANILVWLMQQKQPIDAKNILLVQRFH
jgi:sugar-specific transcriptional regulator TrmB